MRDYRFTRCSQVPSKFTHDPGCDLSVRARQVWKIRPDPIRSNSIFLRFQFHRYKISRSNRPLISVDKGALIFTAPFYSRTGGSTSPYLSVLAGNVRKKSFRFWRCNRFYLLFSFHPPRWCTATPDPRQLFTFYLSMYPYIYIYMHTGLETGKFNDLPIQRETIFNNAYVWFAYVT